MDVQDFDNGISDILSRYERVSKLPSKQLAFSELSLIDKSMSIKLSDRLLYALSLSNDKASFIKKVVMNSEHKSLLMPFYKHAILKNSSPKNHSVELLGSSTVALKYKNLMPFMLSKMHPKKIKLTGFRGEDDVIWFAEKIGGNTQNKFSCVGYEGDEKKVSYMNLWEKGYERIAGDKKSISDECRVDMGSSFNSEAVKNVGLFIGQKVIPKLDDEYSNELLDRVLNGIEDSRKPSNKRPGHN